MNFKDILNRDLVNLENCEQEPIHIPGSIQPHGFLIAIKLVSGEIMFCSENSDQHTGIRYQQILGKNFRDFFNAAACASIDDFVKNPVENSVFFKTVVAEKPFECVAHVSYDDLIVELEAEDTTAEAVDMFKLSRQYLGYMEDSHNLKELCSLVSEGIRRITGYDRVMIYHFDKDYNGEVIAESKRDDLESFMGLHYPHTDIPPQARELYIKNLIRIIVDIDYKPVPIFTIDRGQTTNLDLSYATLRSTSPIHVQYLQNMGVGGTLTISLLHKKKLWGLVACHHYSPKYLGNEIKLAAKLQGHFITSQIDVRQANEDYEISLKANEATENMSSLKLSLNRASLQQMITNPNLLQVCNANGVSILADGVVYSAGLAPAEEQIKTLCAYFSTHTSHSHFNTDSLVKKYPGLTAVAEKFPGINYYPLDSTSDNCVIWYRAETISEVHWAGDPAKAIEKNKNGLSPRKSFESWKVIVKSHSKPWLQSEINASANFVNILEKHLSSVLLAEEEEKQRQLAEILKQTNAELENINWISTHDLQEPLRKIQMMASLIMNKDEGLPEDFVTKVNKMKLSAERMQILIKDILKYTKLQYSKEAFETVDLNAILSKVTANLEDAIHEKPITLSVDELPAVQGVPFLLVQLFTNLVNNSLKFTHPDRNLLINISAEKFTTDTDANSGAGKNFTVISISDNGIGFDNEYKESIFNIFTRLHSNKDYVGSGIGLALCKKIMSAHKGFMEADGRVNGGATFKLYFPETAS